MDHKELDVWKKGLELVLEVYKLTKIFPKEEIYGLTSQIRKSVVSIISNIAEGAARSSNREFIRFLYIAMGSTSELETQLIIASKLGYLKNEQMLLDLLEREKRLLLGLIKYLKGKVK